MNNEEDDWLDKPVEKHVPQSLPMNIKKMFEAMEAKAKKQLRYMEMEGFIEPTGNPGEYRYTNEGLVLAQQEYKKLQEQGLL